MNGHLVIELPILVGTEERCPDLRHPVLCDHLEPRLECVVNLDLSLVCVHLYSASTGSMIDVITQY